MLFAPRIKGLGKENFLKLGDQEEVTGLFLGEIYTFKRHWTNNRGVECTGTGCPICNVDKENYPAFRFRINAAVFSNGQWLPKIFESGGETYDLLTSLDKKFDLSKTLVDIKRRGLKQNTKYDILPRLDQQITPDMDSKIRSMPLLQLSGSPTVGAA